MARIGLIDVDNTSFPNLALGKIARHYKAMGDSVEWVDSLFGGGFNKVYMSKVFTFTPDYDYPIVADEIERGGTGYDIHKALPNEIDRLQPDYDFLGVPSDTTKGVKSREELESIDPKDKEKRFVPAEALKKTSPEWQRFRNCILSSLHKKEADLMEYVFDYNGQIAKAKEKDAAGEKYEGKGDFKTNEAYIRRHIQKHKDRDKTRLKEFFERAKALKIISSYKKTKSGVYSWQWGNKSEDENED